MKYGSQNKSIGLHFKTYGNSSEDRYVVFDSCFESGNLGSVYMRNDSTPIRVKDNHI